VSLPALRAADAAAVPALLTTAQAAEYLGVSLRTMRRLIAERRVRHYKPSGQLRFSPVDLDDFLAASVREVVR
jgi:excisionase family DNA binding protein